MLLFFIPLIECCMAAVPEPLVRWCMAVKKHSRTWTFGGMMHGCEKHSRTLNHWLTDAWLWETLPYLHLWWGDAWLLESLLYLDLWWDDAWLWEHSSTIDRMRPCYEKCCCTLNLLWDVAWLWEKLPYLNLWWDHAWLWKTLPFLKLLIEWCLDVRTLPFLKPLIECIAVRNVAVPEPLVQ